MNIKEAREALALTLTDIAGGAIEKGLTAQTKCFIADHDLNELSDDNIGSAVLIAGEILVGTEGSEQKLLLECAVCVNDGEVTSEDMLREVNTLRESMKELCEQLDEKGNAEEAFAAVVPEEELPEPPRVYDNRRFYIACGVGALVLVALILIVGGLFK